MKAKLFLSCGQSNSFEEPAIVEGIATRIRALGFDCYVAVDEQSLRSLRENIFGQLNSSDYFVFIDFKREALNVGGNVPVFRGSLFSHQELAIASFIGIPCLILQESGIKRPDGMLGAIQGNPTPFADRHLLSNVVADLIGEKLRKKEWRTDTRNALTLELADPQFTEAFVAGGVSARFYHIAVRNHHYQKAALGCHAYLDEIEDLRTNLVSRPKTIEIKWAGTLLAGVRIGPKTVREFDGVIVILSSPIEPKFCMITDSTEYVPRLRGPSKYRLSFSVVSQNFGTVTSDFILEYGQMPGSLDFCKTS